MPTLELQDERRVGLTELKYGLTRHCSVCKKEKPFSEFRLRPSRPFGHDYRCKDCCNQIQNKKYLERKLDNAGRLISNEGDKRCSKCKQVKAVTEFHIDRAANDGRRKHCKPCATQHSKNHNQERPHIYKAIRRRALYARYGITADQYDQMLSQQGGGCAICGATSEQHERQARPLHIDHDHATGKVRGILCTGCNTGLGKFRDDPSLIQAAIDYLTTHKQA